MLMVKIILPFSYPIGSRQNTNELKQVLGKAVIDDRYTYSFVTEVGVTGNKQRTRLIPKLEISLPGRDPYKLGGSLLYRPMKRLDVDLTLENVFKDTVALNGGFFFLRMNALFFNLLGTFCLHPSC